ncbi:MAG TPA: asparagine synthase (glutamine-hydrolyzing) [Arcobacter sp.]|jgi:asparagine synthase (glutamine-hydrolysing)|nr:asparagine synthase (glutamine-hydrolyzing) [Arcobacter sp.]
MCGILGSNFQSNFFETALKLLQNRGPDFNSYTTFNNTILGHTRLCIIDLDSEANQPMEFDNIIIVFNGEIYNYKELITTHNLSCITKSDTEVLIRLYQKYDTEFLNYLNGAFSFCIYDKEKNRFFGARDRYGKKPFYYYNKENKFIFSSLIKPIITLLGSTPKLNKIALSQYLQYFTPIAPNTFYSDIYKLDKASYLLYENNTLTIKKYYKIKTYKKIYEEPIALEKIEDTLFSAVETRLVSDVEIGSLLSGGIDSSLISSIYSQLSNKPIKTFSVGYDEHKKYSELPYAKLLSSHIKSDHNEVILKKQTYINSLEDVFDSLEEPHADHAAIPLYSLTREIKSQGIKTVFSGEGSDELFLGYDNYKKFYDYYMFDKTLTNKQRDFLKLNINTIKQDTKETSYLKRVLQKQTIYNSFGEIFTHNQKKLLFKKVPTFKEEKEKSDPVDWMSSIDMKIWLGESLLSKVDKISMANSVETRNPFLDVHLVDLVFSIDSKLKLGNTNKYLLKKIAQKYIPSEIINRQKKGFNSPYNEWLHSEYKDSILTTILDANYIHNLFNISYIKELYNLALNNKQKQHIYALWVFSKWYLNNYN